MRLTKRSLANDLTDTIDMSNHNADHARVKLAIDRLKDFEMELGENPRIYYAEGLLWSLSLGQGIKAFQCFAKALELDPSYENAAVNAAMYAPNEEEFRIYGDIVSRLSPDRKIYIHKKINALSQGIPYWKVILSEYEEKKSIISAKIELALASAKLDSEQELNYRRNRFEILRSIDLENQRMRESKGEAFPSDERLALQEALLELEKAIVLDPYDATFWNYKAEWCKRTT